MPFLNTEHSRAAYVTDFVLYSVVALALLVYLGWSLPLADWSGIAVFGLLGALAWSALEYGLHRFVLHGLPPFSRWHAEHHRRPEALICTPTLVSAALFGGVFYLPARWLLGDWRAEAFMLGLLSGYLVYTALHHALHHGHSSNAWFLRRQRWHARHHHVRPLGCYGVTTGFWDGCLSPRQRLLPSR